MECTQRLECTQDLYDSPTEKVCPEQIGFLGICGAKYPVKRGPNKIGRDPQTCNIVLQLESISRQHAVINILNKTEYMLMDLDSANKTKLLDKTLLPYIPHPLKNGDTVQFGKVFGVFRLLQEDDALPATQALEADSPAPAPRRGPAATVPESPDISDRDDSFIALSQPKLQNQFKNDGKHFLKPSAKTISIQPVGSKKIDNIFWNSSKRSTSIGSTLDESSQSNALDTSVNKSKDLNLHEMETQAPTDNAQNVSVDSNTQMPHACNQNVSVDSIYTANTQMPDAGKQKVSMDSIYTADTQLPNVCNNNVSMDSIYTANTQAPDDCNPTLSIHSVDTQMPIHDHLPNVRKVQNQQDMHFNFCVVSKESENSIFNAETQQVIPNMSKKAESVTPKSVKPHNTTQSKSSLNTSEEEIIFDELDNDDFQDDFESQSLLPESPKTRTKFMEDESKTDFTINLKQSAKRNIRLKSDSSTDCDDIEIAPTQQLPTKPNEDDLTDCEDGVDQDITNTNNLPESKIKFEEMLTQVILHEEPSKVNNNNKVQYGTTSKLSIASTSEVPFEDMLTQVIGEDTPNNQQKNNLNFEDIPTQIITNEKVLPENANLEDIQTQVLHDDISDNVNKPKNISNDFISPFKIPLQSPRKAKRKDTLKVSQSKDITKDNLKVAGINEKDDKYYEATQDILDDLCTQPQLSPEVLPVRQNDDEVVPSSVEEFLIGDNKLPGLDFDISPKSSDSNIDEKLNQFVTSLSKEQIRDVIGVENLKRQPSDPSDSEATPKKVHPGKFFEIDLPNSQEIKTSVSLHYKSNVTESSSESETENETEDQFTPILYRKRRKPKVNAKLDLTKKLDVDALPSRVSTRIRKPASKLLDSDGDIKKRSENILQPKFLTEQEGDISNEIIIENITRLKNKNNKNEKNKSNTDVNIENQKPNSDSNSVSKTAAKSEHSKKDKRISDDNKETKLSVATLSNTKTIISDVVNIDLTDENSKRSTRSTRNKQRQTDKDLEMSSSSSHKFNDKKSKKEDGKRKQNKNETVSSKKRDKQESEGTKEVRRSRRQKSYKEKKENDSLIKVKITKPAKKEPKPAPVQHEKSAVYSVSSDSGAESPRGRKRAAAAPRAPRAKRARPAPDPAPAAGPAPVAGPAPAADGAPPGRMRVLFTAFPFEEVKHKLESLGAEVVSDVRQCSVVVTLAVKRTCKLLCAAGLGRPIVGAAWVQACADAHHLQDPWRYLLRDEAAERRFGFSLRRTLRGPRGFLRGCRVSATPAVRPPPHELRLIVECSGGTWGEGGGGGGGGAGAGGERWLVVSCGADRALWGPLAARGAALVGSELVLAGALRQRLDLPAARLA